MRIAGKIIFIFALVLLAGYFLLTKTTYLDFVKTWPLIGDRVCCINDSNSEVVKGAGFIEGSLSYPSDFIPPMTICAEEIVTKKQYCTTEHIKNSKYKYGQGYKLSVPVGNYYVFATTEGLGNYRAYHSEARCGETGGKSHDPILVEVRPGINVGGVDPCDWYK